MEEYEFCAKNTCGKLAAHTVSPNENRPRRPEATRPVTARQRHPVPPEFMPRR